MIRNCFFIFFVLTFFSTVRSTAQTLVLWHADGTTTDVELYQQPRVTFEDDKLVIMSSVLDMRFDKSDVLRFTYKVGTMGVNTPTEDSNVDQQGDKIVFHNIKPNDQVTIHSSNGIRVPVRLSRIGNDVTLSLSQIPNGVYMLTVNGRTSKFAKR